MKITKNGRELRSVDEWFTFAPPKKGQEQWVDGRSAKELAKAWFPTAGRPSVPKEFLDLVNSSKKLGSVRLCEGEPELAVRFDPFRGETRNCDLLVHAVCDRGKIEISVEAKADEAFNGLVGECYDEGVQLSCHRATNIPERIRRLASAVLANQVEDIRDLRYQLLHGTAAALSAAKRREAMAALFVVHEFVTDGTDDAKHKRNTEDLNKFVAVLTRNPSMTIRSGILLGPFRVPGNPDIPDNVDLFVGKAVRITRLHKSNKAVAESKTISKRSEPF